MKLALEARESQEAGFTQPLGENIALLSMHEKMREGGSLRWFCICSHQFAKVVHA